MCSSSAVASGFLSSLYIYLLQISFIPLKSSLRFLGYISMPIDTFSFSLCFFFLFSFFVSLVMNMLSPEVPAHLVTRL